MDKLGPSQSLASRLPFKAVLVNVNDPLVGVYRITLGESVYPVFWRPARAAAVVAIKLIALSVIKSGVDGIFDANFQP